MPRRRRAVPVGEFQLGPIGVAAHAHEILDRLEQRQDLARERPPRDVADHDPEIVTGELLRLEHRS
jgi:hypothetical protein